MENHLPNIFYFPNCVTTFPYRYTQKELDDMKPDERERFKYATFPIIKHRWSHAYVVKDNHVFKLNVETSKRLRRATPPTLSVPVSMNTMLREYITQDGTKISFECYSYLTCKKATSLHDLDDNAIRGLVEGGNRLQLFTNSVGSVKDTVGIFGNPNPFMKVPLKSLHPSMQCKIFESWIHHVPVVLTGDTGVGKTSQVPKLLLWFNYLFGGFVNLSTITFDVQEKPIVLSLPRVALVKLHSETLLTSLGFNEIHKSPVSLKFGNMQEQFVNTRFRRYGIVFSTHKITLNTLFNYSTVILDEVHEHDQTGDIIIAVCRKYIRKLDSLFLMTATLEDDRQRIEEFFTESVFVHIPGGTLFSISEAYVKNSNDSLNKFMYIEEEKRNLVNAIKTYTPPKQSSGIVFVSTVSQCDVYKQYLSERLPYKFYIIHGKIQNINDLLSDIYDNEGVSIIISTPYLESSVTVQNATHVYDTGRVYIPSPYGGREVFISKSMRDQRKGRVGRVKPGMYIYFYDVSELRPIKRIDFEFLHNYVLYSKVFDLQLPEDLFVKPTNMTRLRDVIEYIRSFNISDGVWTRLLSSYYIHILEYAKVYARGGQSAAALDSFERTGNLTDDALDAIKSLNMRAKIISHRKASTHTYALMCRLLFGVYAGKTFIAYHKRPLTGYITMITEHSFIPEY
ncbi:gp044R [Rabbit fibroma virus]|uniref:RNA helicase NPH-II n=1 Tax=Rabbit fibroma virus (strain Kasza) TaxID=10272 RepID=NPH2_RFVKA|nr:RNA helicase NPH-II [Rabbit fibroma virus]Q9Q927.1 RecName: Full=RNA helicase NPH-II; AltName: Full=Nucleoside triphosphatase II; Short=NTPase II; AltName: Full=Nucleoside triphosphate phosphohydrolase II; Short=NPH II [Rabbit fibroma virus (strain Kasza)]AAF17926.1 gp044R [Rabbit fibroma virus]